MLKTYYIDIDIEDDRDFSIGMDAISLVEHPAVEHNFLCFDREQPVKLNFNDSKHIVTGVALLANVPIFRNNPDFGEHNVVFTPEVIEKLVELYSKKGLFNSVNLQHNNKNIVNNAYMIESYIVNRQRGIVPNEFDDVPDGSWIVSFKIEDEQLWNEIVNGKSLNGFSIQGLFTYKDSKSEISEPTFDDWIDELIK